MPDEVPSEQDGSAGEPLTGIVLRRFRADRDVRYLGASRQPDGGLLIEGQDLGPGVEAAFGPGITEYEWTWTVEARALPDLVAALNGHPGDDPLRLLVAWTNAHGGIDPGIHLQEAGVPIAFWSRVGD